MTRMVSLYTREKYICSISSIHIKQNGTDALGASGDRRSAKMGSISGSYGT